MKCSDCKHYTCAYKGIPGHWCAIDKNIVGSAALNRRKGKVCEDGRAYKDGLRSLLLKLKPRFPKIAYLTDTFVGKTILVKLQTHSNRIKYGTYISFVCAALAIVDQVIS